MGYASLKVGSKVVKRAISFAREALKNLMQVNLDGAVTDAKHARNFLVAHALRQHGHDLSPSCGQLTHASLAHSARAPAKRSCTVLSSHRCAMQITLEFGGGIACELRT